MSRDPLLRVPVRLFRVEEKEHSHLQVISSRSIRRKPGQDLRIDCLGNLVSCQADKQENRRGGGYWVLPLRFLLYVRSLSTGHCGAPSQLQLPHCFCPTSDHSLLWVSWGPPSFKGSKDFLGGAVVKTPFFHCRGARVPSLIRACLVAKPKKKKHSKLPIPSFHLN